MTARRFLGRFAADRRAIAAVEFALIFPILLVILLGTFEVTRATIVHKKTQKVAYAVDQILNQSDSLTAQQVQKILAASSAVMSPFDLSRLSLEVAYHYVDTNGNVSTQWKQRLANAGTVQLGSETLPAAYKSVREVGYLTTRVRYDLSSIVSSQFLRSVGLTAESIVRPQPRKVITCATC